MIATSPGRSRLTRCLVRFPSRAIPATSRVCAAGSDVAAVEGVTATNEGFYGPVRLGQAVRLRQPDRIGRRAVEREARRRSERQVLVLRDVPVVDEVRDEQECAREPQQEGRGRVDLLLSRRPRSRRWARLIRWP